MIKSFSLAVFLLVFGLVFGGFPAGVLFKHLTTFSDKVETGAVVTNKNSWVSRGGTERSKTQYKIEYLYKDNDYINFQGDDYVLKSFYYQINVGNKVGVFYSQSQPYESYLVEGKTKTMPYFLSIFAVIGSLVFSFGLYNLIYTIKCYKNNRFLKAQGTKTKAVISNIEESYSSNRTQYVKITYAWQDYKNIERTGFVHEMERNTANIKIGDEIEILTSPQKPEISYWEPKFE